MHLKALGLVAAQRVNGLKWKKSFMQAIVFTEMRGKLYDVLGFAEKLKSVFAPPILYQLLPLLLQTGGFLAFCPGIEFPSVFRPIYPSSFRQTMSIHASTSFDLQDVMHNSGRAMKC